MIGAQLPLQANDTWTLALLTNPEVLAVQNTTTGNTPVAVVAPGGPDQHAWVAVPAAAAGAAAAAAAVGDGGAPLAYVALFNAGDAEDKVGVSLASAGVPPSATVCVRDLWQRAEVPGTLPGSGTLAATLPPHGAGLYSVWVCG